MVRKIRAKKRTLLVDGDILCYRIAIAIEEPTEWENDMWTLHSDAKLGRELLENTLNRYLKELNCNNIVVALSDKNNFRKELLPEYKSHRKKVRKPIILKALKKYLYEKYTTYRFPNLEGDDTLGLLATTDLIKGDKVILTKDKDLKTVPSTIWFMQGDDYTIIDEDEANYNHMLQCLQGDATDGYSGCPSVGKITAEKILKPLKGDYKAMWEAVVKRYKMNNLDKKYALLQARLSRIIRATDYNFERKRPVLWTPPR